MVLERLRWQEGSDIADVVGQAERKLVAGEAVSLPTETSYELLAMAVPGPTVDRWPRGGAASSPAVLFLHSAEDLRQMVLRLPPAVERLLDRCLPGPLAFGVPRTMWTDDLRTWMERPEGWLATAEWARLRVTDHPALEQLLSSVAVPVLGTGVEWSAQPVPNAQELPEAWRERASLVVDAGPCRFQLPAGVVAIESEGYRVVHEGVIRAPRIRRLASEVITFVCTGNTCRSPMAEAVFKRMLADRLGVGIEDLPDKGFTVMSAGVATGGGSPASPEAAEAVRAYRATLEDHVSQPLTRELARVSDQLLVMTRDHRDTVLRVWPDLHDKVTLLARDQDIADPYGGPAEDYIETVRQISNALNLWFADWEKSRGRAVSN